MIITTGCNPNPRGTYTYDNHSQQKVKLICSRHLERYLAEARLVTRDEREVQPGSCNVR
jgi:hypothetical protein